MSESPNVQWKEIPFALETPVGGGADALALNPYLAITNPVTHFSSIGGPQWMVDAGSAIGAAKRVARDNAPQKPGEVVHKKFKSGLVTQLRLLAVSFVDPVGGGMIPACDEDLVDLFDGLLRHLNSIENTDGRLTWLPTNKVARMSDDVRWLGSDGGGGGGFTSITAEVDDVVFTGVQFALLSPFPYAMDAPQTITCLGGETPNCSGSGASVLITNDGTGAFYPVLRVYGPPFDTGFFQIDRTSTLTGETLSLVYDASLPGASNLLAGDFIEFDFFRETAYFGGSGANAKPGIDVQLSDFWPLETGDNVLSIGGAAADVFWQPAWAA